MRVFYSLGFLIILTGCSKYIQVFETQPAEPSLKLGELYVYETDTLRITYSFWALKGVVSFEVHNKLDKPIYINWKRSAFIENSSKLNYWVDEETISSTYYGGYLYQGPLLRPSGVISRESSVKTKPERTTFIPPKSNYYRSQFYLMPLENYRLDKNSEVLETTRTGKPKRLTKVYFENFTRQNSPHVFRNFLTFSLSEDFKDEFNIDNEFYLSKTLEMDYRHFKFEYLDESGHRQYLKPFKKPTSFYLYVPWEETVIERLKDKAYWPYY